MVAVSRIAYLTYDRIHYPFLGYAVLYPLGYYFHRYFEPFQIADNLIFRIGIGAYCALLFFASMVRPGRRILPFAVGLLHVVTLLYSFILCHYNELGLSYTIGLTLIIASTISASMNIGFIRGYLGLAITASLMVTLLAADGAHLNPYLFFLATGAIGVFAYQSRRSELDLLDELEASNLEKAEFLATMSHEVRNSLNGIIPVLDLLQNEKDAKRRDEFVSLARRSGRFLLDLISEVLDLSKMEAGRLDLQSQRFRPSHVVELAVQTFLVQAQAAGTQLTLEQNGKDAYCLGDPTRIGQVLNNLISNAVKFTDRGKVHVIASYEVQEDELEISFVVQDSGSGIPEAERELVFDQYSQVHSAGWRQKGTGLGLALSRKLARRMGGDITVNSVSGDFARSGSRFEFRFNLPLDRTGSSVSHPGGDLDQGRALVVDDDAVSRIVMQNLLETLGLSVEVLGDIKEVRNRLATEKYDYVFLDLEIEQESGIELRRSLGTGHRDEAFFLVTAHSGGEIHERARAAGFDAVLNKPLDMEMLRSFLVSEQDDVTISES